MIHRLCLICEKPMRKSKHTTVYTHKGGEVLIMNTHKICKVRKAAVTDKGEE